MLGQESNYIKTKSRCVNVLSSRLTPIISIIIIIIIYVQRQCNKRTLPSHLKKSNSPNIHAFMTIKTTLTILLLNDETICYVLDGEWLFCTVVADDGPFSCGILLLYGWFELHSTVYTLSILLSFSKNGIRSKSSESVMSSNHEATGTCTKKNKNILIIDGQKTVFEKQIKLFLKFLFSINSK